MGSLLGRLEAAMAADATGKEANVKDAEMDVDGFGTPWPKGTAKGTSTQARGDAKLGE